MNITEIIASIPFTSGNLVIKEIKEGFSDEKKFYIENNNQEKRLLRISDISAYDRKFFEFELLKKVNAKGINSPFPLAFGLCNQNKNVYMVLTWIDGVDAIDVIGKLSARDQYSLGYRSGMFLNSIHQIKAEMEEPWFDFFSKKVLKKIAEYQELGYDIKEANEMISFLKNNFDVLQNRPITYQHGDFHLGNMIYTSNRDIAIIDFNRASIGDPFEEFDRMIWTTSVSKEFAVGMINSYFNDCVPLSFFKLLCFYSCSTAISGIYFGKKIGIEAEKTAIRNLKQIYLEFSQLKDVIPNWYTTKEVIDKNI